MELDTLSQAMYHARELAMSRMEAEADALGADGIVGVRLEIEFKEFAMTSPSSSPSHGRQVRRQGELAQRREQAFHSDLSGQTSGPHPGWIRAARHGDGQLRLPHRPPGSLKAMGNVGRNVEIPKFTEALYDAASWR